MLDFYFEDLDFQDTKGHKNYMKGKNHTEVWLMGCGSACNARLIHPMFKVSCHQDIAVLQ